MTGSLAYVEGDMFPGLHAPPAPGPIFVPHVVNDVGGWGAGFVVPLGRAFPLAQTNYREWFKLKGKGPTRGMTPEFVLGETQNVKVKDDPESPVYVCNMLAQRGLGPGRVIRYNALARCMDKVALYVGRAGGGRVAAPMFGAGLGGGDWNLIERLVEDCWLERGLDVTVYYLPGTLPANWAPPAQKTA